MKGDEKRAIADDVFLGEKNLKRRELTAECSHVLRRPGVGVSEVASSVIGGVDVLKSLEHADLGRLGLLLEKDGLMDAFKMLNTHTGGEVST